MQAAGCVGAAVHAQAAGWLCIAASCARAAAPLPLRSLVYKAVQAPETAPLLQQALQSKAGKSRDPARPYAGLAGACVQQRSSSSTRLVRSQCACVCLSCSLRTLRRATLPRMQAWPTCCLSSLAPRCSSWCRGACRQRCVCTACAHARDIHLHKRSACTRPSGCATSARPLPPDLSQPTARTPAHPFTLHHPQVDAHLSHDAKATYDRAMRLMDLYAARGVEPRRVYIKLASTWEGISAARKLQRQGVDCNCTLLFSFGQARAAARPRCMLRACMLLVCAVGGRVTRRAHMHARAPRAGGRVCRRGRGHHQPLCRPHPGLAQGQGWPRLCSI